jgi:hypothetical protein
VKEVGGGLCSVGRRDSSTYTKKSRKEPSIGSSLRAGGRERGTSRIAWDHPHVSSARHLFEYIAPLELLSWIDRWFYKYAVPNGTGKTINSLTSL